MAVLLCDLDDTLVDRAGAFAAWANQFVANHGQDSALADWLVAEDGDGRRPRSELFAALRARLALDASVAELKASYHREMTRFFVPDHDVLTALDAARAAGWKIAVVTNSPNAALQRRKLSATGIATKVDAVCTSAEDGASKPDPALLVQAASRCRCSLDGAWMIGDHPADDVGAAIAAGVRSAWLRRGRQWPRTDCKPTLEAASFTEAVEHILGSTARGILG